MGYSIAINRPPDHVVRHVSTVRLDRTEVDFLSLLTESSPFRPYTRRSLTLAAGKPLRFTQTRSMIYPV